ncbi:hypothetical protein AHAT_17170 [Agarivorans sp. Toyoura001]|nr:hypothetical protein AHAT_17170 [Agarivorans sp. Toyoura001]
MTLTKSLMLSKGSNKFKGTTDEKGEATALRVGLFGVIVRINKEGYYQSKRLSPRGLSSCLTT